MECGGGCRGDVKEHTHRGYKLLRRKQVIYGKCIYKWIISKKGTV